MKNNIINVRRTLQDLLRALPAIESTGSQDTIRKHLALIRFYQDRYSAIVSQQASQQPLPA